ncbi:MAG: fatty acid desaturase [Leptolyngbyaceae cyanobacterium SL_7_1]|nr:fatty acid desaturase [Leptolyngbyaceae cyanobacterium SL_7_1]
MVTSAPINPSSYTHRQQPVENAIVIAYTLIAYVGGVALLLFPAIWLNVLGFLLLSHSLIFSAYLSHELMHSTLFATRQANALWGTVMLWLNGGCYATFQELALRHIAHHVDRVDFSSFDLAATLQSLPKPLRQTILVLEWLYIPVISFWVQWRSIISPLRDTNRRDERGRIVLTLLIRGALFTLLAIVSPKALILYFLAYIIMVTVLRWQDAFQHTYEVFPVGSALPKRDRQHEQANTFSTLISQRFPWLNLLLLNFGYHNAHHEVMKCPWHALPELDRALFQGTEVHYVPLSQLLRSYHRFRVLRIFSGQGIAVDKQGNPTPDTFYGAVGVSFLVPHS